MPPIDDYALPVNTNTGAFVTDGGSIEWLCLPHVDSAASFAALLSNEEQGRRRLTLETGFETAEGSIRLVDFMPRHGKAHDVLRLVEGIRGRVRMQMDLIVRLDHVCSPLPRRTEAE